MKIGSPAYEHIVQSKDLTSDLMPPPLYINESYLLCYQLNASSRPLEIDSLGRQLSAQVHHYEAQYQEWQQRLRHQPDMARLLQPSHQSAQRFHQLALTRLLPAVQQADAHARDETMRQLAEVFERHHREVDEAVKTARADEEEAERRVAARMEADRVKLMVAGVAALLLALALANRIRRSITVPLEGAVALAERVARGDLTPMDAPPFSDEPAQLLKALNHMSTQLQAHMETLRQREAEARQSNALLQDLITAADLIVVGVGPQGRILLFSPSAAKALGCPVEQAMAMNWEELKARLNPAIAPGLPHTSGDAVEPHKQGISYDFTNMKGHRRRIVWRASQHPQGVQGLTSGDIEKLYLGLDITEQWQSQQMIHRAMASADEAEQNSQALVERVNQEVRGAANTILGMSSLARQGIDEATAQHYLDRIQAAAGNLVGRLGNLVDLALLEAGQLKPSQRPFRLQDVLDEVLTRTVQDADDKGLQLRLVADETLPSIWRGDALRLSQTLRALVSRAIEGSDQGEIVLRVSAADERNGSSVQTLSFEIQDQGRSLSPQHLAQLLSSPLEGEASRGGHALRRPSDPLGLTLARRLISLMGGSLSVSSDPDSGTRFVVLLPLAVAADDRRPTDTPLASLRPMRILVLDSDPDVREILCQWLQTLKMRPLAVAHLDEALQALQQARDEGQPFEVLLLDWPRHDARAQHRLSALQHDPALGRGLSFLVCSVDSQDRLEEQATDFRFTDLLAKPLRVSALLNALRNCQIQPA